MSETARSPRHAPTVVSAQKLTTLPAASARCRLDVGCATSPGLERARNEDSFFAQHLSWCNHDQHQELALLVVADGMGGHEAGDEASGLAIRAVAASLQPLVACAVSGKFAHLPDSALVRWIEDALREANQLVWERSAGQPAERAMAATVTAVLAWNDRVVVGHVGDCRLYHYRSPQLRQLTRDQTTVARLVELGRIRPEEAHDHPRAGEVTHAIGGRADVQPLTYQLTLTPGDWLLIACDGFYTHVEEPDVAAILQSGPPSALKLARYLVEKADQSGGHDNSTVVAVGCS